MPINLSFYPELLKKIAREKAKVIIQRAFRVLDIILKISLRGDYSDILAQGELLSTSYFKHF